MTEKTLRVRSNTIETPIWEFERKETGSDISVVGMMHLGEQAYYDEIAAHVAENELKGHVIHYEKIKFTKKLKDAETLLENENFPVEIIQRHIGGVRQIDALKYSFHWQNHDISGQELISLLGPDYLKKSADRAMGFKQAHAKNPELTGRILRAGFRFMPIIKRLNEIRDNDSQDDKEEKEVIVHHRNRVAVRAVERLITQEPHRSVTMLWGANHLPGIAEGLENLGYNRSGVRWLGALSLKKSRN